MKKLKKSIAFYMQCFYNTIIGNVTDTDTETVAVERCEVHIMRTSGILLPVASLPSKYGIGAFSKEAYKFVDTLEKAGHSVRPDRVWRFAVSVFLHFCRKSVFYRPGKADKKGLDYKR